MILAAHQPTYLPDLAFFYKMTVADKFVIADNLQFSKHGAINRAKIKTARGINWLTVPVLTKGREGQIIAELEINSAQSWQRKHWKTLVVNYTYAAYFEKYADFFANLYEERWRKLLNLNLEIIKYLSQCLNVSTQVVLLSDLNVTGKGSELLVNLANQLGCKTYLVEEAFESYLDCELFRATGVEITFATPRFVEYHQQFGEFVHGLSVIDLLFNEGEASLDIIMESFH